MPRVKVYDVPGGDTITFDLVDESTGYLQPTFNRPEDEHLVDFHKIKDILCREDDVLLNSYPKTGSSWMYEIVALLTTKSPKVTGKSKMGEMIDCLPNARVKELPSPRILNSHLKIKYLPKDAFRQKIKMFLVLRNPKDIVPSFYHHTRGLKPYEYTGKFENFLQAFMRGEVDSGSYSEYLLDWQQFIHDNPDYPLLLVYYEDLKQDLFGQLKRIRQFLELDVSDDLLQEISDSLMFNNMRKGKEAAMSEEQKVFHNFVAKSGFSFLRKGQVGDWKNYFTVAQNETFDEWWKHESKDVNLFNFKFE